MNKLEDYFFNKEKHLHINKWNHYFKIYDRHFKKFTDKNPTILEIGVQYGGSLEMWDYYFDGKCQIYGMDINPNCLSVPKRLGKDNIQIFIVDQGDRNQLKNFAIRVPKFDIIIDDGGHHMSQQIATYEELYYKLNDGGVYLCEDLHTSYWPEYGGGYKNPNSFIEYTKNFIDYINAYHSRTDMNLDFRKSTKSIHYYDSVIVLEKEYDFVAPSTADYVAPDAQIDLCNLAHHD